MTTFRPPGFRPACFAVSLFLLLGLFGGMGLAPVLAGPAPVQT
jgi:hypothetical protein